MNFSEDEVIIHADLCASSESVQEESLDAVDASQPEPTVNVLSVENIPMAARTSVHLRLPFLRKHTTGFMGLLYSLQQHFSHVVVELHADDGQISEPTYQQQIEDIVQRIRQ